jgi:hypothetical protein
VFHTPHYFRFSRQLDNPDLYKEQFVRVCMDTVRVIGISGASAKRPKAPAFVQLTPLAPRWESLRSIVHNILHLGVIGYPFVNPGPIGGEVIAGGGNATAEPPPLELFVRWWQLATFLPQLHFTYPPSAYRDLNIAPVARKLRSLKEDVVRPELLYFGREAMELSRPIIRPLWMLNPLDKTAQRSDFELSLLFYVKLVLLTSFRF